MIANFTLRFLASGLQEVGSKWTRAHNPFDECFKLYLPLEGEACCVMEGGQSLRLAPGSLFLINGYRIKQSVCEKRMKVAWLHFVPESLPLRRLLDHSADFQVLEHAAFPRISPEAIASSSHPASGVSSLLGIHGLLLEMIGSVLERSDAESRFRNDPAYLRIAPVLDYLNLHYLDNPPLEEMAALVHLAPNYFHRMFRQVFNTTPYRYMESKRMELARQLLSTTELPIGEIAEECGYENGFYFSRIFKKCLGRAPLVFRKEMRHSTAL
ncbi:Arabinose operon regulatory protein [Pontiella desulfatans]|uniref:Arabinose operon regulatory protein n=1 Tax=Pontiella desulfatans TaxID=2750659 RepID=A0A6C2U2I7_PONDE|nr:AraC family transcriptional regulator [Pontiella desulfatans]VGO14190.1 Arabinose operon regulatory protein [Pontiella desulfatans]